MMPAYVHKPTFRSYARPPRRAQHVKPYAAAQPYSMSRSLAHELVSRLTAQTAQAGPLSIHDAGIIQPTLERAAAFPRVCAWLARSIPHHLLIHSAVLADEQNRSRKDDRFIALHWTADPLRKCVVARLHVVHARKLEEAQGTLLLVTMPALMQAFYRHNTLESGAVLCELSYAAKAALAWHEAMRHRRPGEEILLPTPNGALAVVRDADRRAGFGGLVARTWMSDRQMKDNYRRLTAVRRARLECSVVINRAPFPLSAGRKPTGWSRRRRRHEQLTHLKGPIMLHAAELSAVPVERRHPDGEGTPHILEERIRQLEQQLVAMTAQAHRDPLTGLFNRRGFETAYRILDGQAMRTDSLIACVAIDLDDFKAMNDELGHLAGDAALQAFAVRLTACCRRQDVCARFGGDEFILLLPGTKSDQASSLVERIRDPGNLRECVNPANYQLSFSAGIAHGVAQVQLVELLAAADGALRKAKKAGKARTVSIAL